MIYDLGILIEQDLLTGFHIGTHAEIPIAQDFYVQPGLLFSTKGAKEKEGDYTAKVKIAYIELPVHLIYKPQPGDGKLILGFGPYLAYSTWIPVMKGMMKMNRLPKTQVLVFQPDTDSKIGSQNENKEKFRQDIHYLPEFLLKRNQFHIEY